MMTKPKPDSRQEKSASPLPIMNVEKETSADDREQDLERRLALLGIGNETEATTLEDLTNGELESNVEEKVEEEKKKEDNLMSFDPIPVSAPPVIESKPEPVVTAPAPTKPNKSALLVSSKKQFKLRYLLIKIQEFPVTFQSNDQYEKIEIETGKYLLSTRIFWTLDELNLKLFPN